MSHYRPRDGKDGIPGTHGKDGRDGEQGPIGPMPEHEWIGTNLRFQEPDGDWGEFVDLEGPKGEQGEPGRDGADGKDGRDGKDGADGERGSRGAAGSDGQDGAMGPMPDHQWSGTRLRFEEPDGDWGRYVDLRGPAGPNGAPGGRGADGEQGPKGDPGSVGNLDNGPGIELDTDSSDVTTISFNADTAEVAHLPGATYTTLQKMIDVLHSPGLITGGTFSDGGGGNLNVSGGTVSIRDFDDDVSTLYLADFPDAVLAIPSDSQTRFIGVERNGTNPQVIQKTSNTWDMDTEFPLGTVANLGGTLFPFFNPFKVGDPITNIIQRFDAQATIIRSAEGGIELGNTGTRQATLTAGVAWARLNDYPITEKNSGTQTLIGIRPNPAAPPPLVFDLGLTQWPNTQYLSGTTLTTMTNNRWAVLWFFVNIGTNAWGFAYGTSQYNNSAQAAQEGIPSYLTANFLANNLLVGRFLFEKNSDTPIVESAFTRVFSTQAVSDHNQLSNLQGGTVGEYYHLTNAEHTFLSSVGSAATFDERAQDAVGNNVLDTATVNLTYNDTTGQISADVIPGGLTGSFVTISTAQTVTGEKRFDTPLGIMAAPNVADALLLVNANSLSNPTPAIEAEADNGTTQANISATTYGANGGGIFHGRGARGTKALPTAVQAGDIYAGYGGRPYASGVGFTASSPVSLHWVASENQTSTALGGYFRVLTTPKGSATRQERLLVCDSGTTFSHDTSTHDPASATQVNFLSGWTGFLSSAVGQNSRLVAVSYGSGAGTLNLCSARGTPAAPAVLQSGDAIGAFSYTCWTTGGTWVAPVAVQAFASENHTGTAAGADLVFRTTPNGSVLSRETFHVRNDGRVSGKFLHNNSGSVAGTSDQYIASGTYTPTLTNSTNISSSTATACQWIRVGNVVTVSGRVVIDPTAVGLIQLGMSLPIASDFSSVEQAGGTGASNNEFFRVYADAANDRVTIESIIKVDAASAGFHFSFTYLVL